MTDLTETTISSRRIHEGRTVKLRLDTVRHPDGTTGTKEVIEHPGAVAIVALLPLKRVLMVRQFRTAAGRVLLEIPAGTIEAGESPEECARREIVEETGHAAGKFEKLFHGFVAPGYSQEVIHTFLATALTPMVGKGDDDEFIDVIEMPLADVVRLIETGEIEDMKSIAGLLYVQRLLADVQEIVPLL